MPRSGAGEYSPPEPAALPTIRPSGIGVPGPRAWHRLRLPLTHFLGRYPRLSGACIGYGVAALMVVVFCLTAIGLRIQQTEDGHCKVLARMKAMQVDTRKLLDELNAGYPPDCHADNLRRLNGLMFKHRYARGIGLLDDQGRLFCSVGAGPVEPRPTTAGGGIDGSIGRYLIGVPVELFVGPVAGSPTATVVERGRFQVLVDGALTDDAFAEHAGVVWAGAGAQRRRVFSGALGAYTETTVGPDAPDLRVDWAHARLLVTTTVPGVSPVSVQSALGWHTLDDGRARVLLVAAAFCGLFGFLLAGGLARRFRAYESIDYRIRYLCAPANVVCHYQPILELASGRMIGCEVLARLRDGDALLYPDKFIPALNRQHLGWAFDAAVSRAALHELGAALPPQTSFSVALNFFPQNLQRDTIQAHLSSVLAEIGRSDLRIELEVTEYDFSPDLAPELRRLKADGYGISIDDFGTGYSNLGIVKRVSPDYLKIDRSFVFEMGDETIRSSLIPEIVAIARAVGSEVIAEGIETAAQLAQLKQLGVQYGQGYHFARPMPLADLQRFIATNVASVAAGGL